VIIRYKQGISGTHMWELPEIGFKHIAVEGVFKSAKTRLANLLGQRLGAKSVLDRSENPYLKDFYDEKDGAAFLAQLVFLVTRYHQQIGLVQRDLFEDRLVCDYIFEKDKIYAYQTLSDDELLVYDKIYGVLAERVPKPDLVIYLQISPSTLMRRITREGTALEKNISEKYLQDLVEAFDFFFFNYQATPLLVIKSDELDLAGESDFRDIIDQIAQMKRTPLFFVPQSYEPREAKKR
jgi:deoxyadenosine/deoxycytidine kinase